MRLLTNTKFNCCTYILEKLTGLQKSSLATLQEASDHVNFQISTERSRVGFLIEKISNNDPNLQAIAIVHINNNGMRNNLKKPTAFLLPVHPYAKHRASNNTNTKNHHISYVTSKGKIHSKAVIYIRWHTNNEYYQLLK